MALSDTGKAMGKVTQLLVDRLGIKTGLTVAEGRPEPPSTGTSDHQLNLFLYEASFDPSLRNVALEPGQPEPLWLVLHYLLTAFDGDGNSDTIGAHENMGVGIRALQELNFLSLESPVDPDILRSLGENPEPLKITFDEIPSDSLSKLMQGADEKYRFSMGFQVRPVMIATGQPPSYSLLVGVDYTQTPREIIGEEGIDIQVIPSLGPRITRISPARFELHDTLTLFGTDLHLSGLSVRLGSRVLPVTGQWPDRVECSVNGDLAAGGVISAGSNPVSVVRTLPTGRMRSSNLLVGDLLPSLSGAEVDTASFALASPPPAAARVFGNIDLFGRLLAGEDDDILVALYRDGQVVKMMDEEFNFTLAQPPSPPVPPWARIRLEMKEADAVPPGRYRIILRVNGQQAKNSPEVELPVP
ncbi:MAG: DUF4255 domain-containing protein [Desulfobacteraceae bacterium]|nr:DUF4255 domain-containing protein [Desulfobacteraceae bacterium]